MRQRFPVRDRREAVVPSWSAPPRLAAPGAARTSGSRAVRSPTFWRRLELLQFDLNEPW